MVKMKRETVVVRMLRTVSLAAPLMADRPYLSPTLAHGIRERSMSEPPDAPRNGTTCSAACGTAPWQNRGGHRPVRLQR
ncbi:protein of unknown function [Paraburkholderia kururiensis]